LFQIFLAGNLGQSEMIILRTWLPAEHAWTVNIPQDGFKVQKSVLRHSSSVCTSVCASACLTACVCARVRACVRVSVSMPAYESFSISSAPGTKPDRPPLRHPRRPNADRHQIHIDNKHNNIIAGDSPICPSRLQRLWNPILQSGFGLVWKQRTRQRLRRAAKAYGDHKVGRRTFMWQTRAEPSRGTLSFPCTPLGAALHLQESNPVRCGLGLLID